MAAVARDPTFGVIDVGHTAPSPGADSARGMPEYDFNLKLADVIASRCTKPVSTKQSDSSREVKVDQFLFQRVASANNVQAHLFISIRCNLVQII